jgi:hypothetical protein
MMESTIRLLNLKPHLAGAGRWQRERRRLSGKDEFDATGKQNLRQRLFLQ